MQLCLLRSLFSLARQTDYARRYADNACDATFQCHVGFLTPTPYHQYNHPPSFVTSYICTRHARSRYIFSIVHFTHNDELIDLARTLSAGLCAAAEAQVLGVVEDEKQGPAIILDKTVFHPQGGGQPSDCGGYLQLLFLFSFLF